MCEPSRDRPVGVPRAEKDVCPHPRLSLIYAEPNGRWECEVCKEVLAMREVFAVPDHASPEFWRATEGYVTPPGEQP